MFKSKKLKIKKPLANYQIRAEKIRLIDKDGKQLGLLELNKAIEKAKEQGLDLIQVTEKVTPPVCKIMDYGKYLYSQKKKESSSKHRKTGGLKGLRLTFGISAHDLETRIKQAEKFLKEGDKIRIEMKLRGREKALKNFAREKIEKFLESLNKLIPIKVEQGLKKAPRGLTLIVSRDLKQEEEKKEKEKL